MKRSVTLIMTALILIGCNNNTDEEAAENVATALEKRWEYADTLPKEVTVEELEKAVQIELDSLKTYDSKDFKDTSFYVLYDNYASDLRLISNVMHGQKADNTSFQKEWNNHLIKRKITLYEINEMHKLGVDNKYEDILSEMIIEGEELHSKKDTYEYVEEMTYRIHEALSEIDGSFEQKSALNAADGRVNSVIGDVKNNLDDEDLIELFNDLRLLVSMAVDEGLNGNYVKLEIYAEMIDDLSDEIKEF